ncbi:MAG TPA: hypothetical protein VN408_15010 [Actinoplanes sp.]|nr:hypothetical protein [Actinoplanes sp.]
MRLTRIVTTGTALAGLTLSLQACTASEASTTQPATVSADSRTAPVDDILAGKRQALIHIAEDDKDWSATYEGPIAIGDGTDDGALFRLVPATGEQDDKGRPTHHITSDKHGTLPVKNDGSALYLQQVGDGGSRGTYSFVDRGPVE